MPVNTLEAERGLQIPMAQSLCRKNYNVLVLFLPSLVFLSYQNPVINLPLHKGGKYTTL